MTIQDVPQDLRLKGAEKLRGRLREMLANPFMTPEQQAALVGRMRDIDAWERGESPKATQAPPKLPPMRSGLVQLPARTPTNHVVEVTEDLKVTDKA